MTIQEILDSKPKSSLIALLLLAPNRSFSGVELSKRLGISQAKLLLFLAELIKQGSVKTFSKQRMQKCFRSGPGQKHSQIRQSKRRADDRRFFQSKAGKKYLTETRQSQGDYRK